MQKVNRLPHVVRKRLADGSVREYVYATRGGPRVHASILSPDFEQRRAEAEEAFSGVSRVRIARRRILDALDEHHRKAAHKLARNSRHRAARKKMLCNLSASHIFEMLQKQGFRCAVSGIKFDLTANLEKLHSRNPLAPSIDRIDNKKGYVVGNVRIVLSAVNYAINEWGMDQYLRICNAVAVTSQY